MDSVYVGLDQPRSPHSVIILHSGGAMKTPAIEDTTI